MQTVELFMAFEWICEECGERHFVSAMRHEMTRAELKASFMRDHNIEHEVDLPENWHEYELLSQPTFVTCPSCRTDYEVEKPRHPFGGDFEDEDDDDE